MPPRKSADRSQATAGSLEQTPSAARRVWDISHIRQMILQGLARDDLARCIRLEKGSLHDVAKELYRVVEYAKWMTMREDSPCSRKYCTAISEINATTYTIPTAVLNQLTLPENLLKGPYSQYHQEIYPSEYQPEVMRLLLAYMREICPNLRTVRFGGEIKLRDKWVAHLAPLPSESTDSAAPTGHIDYFRMLTLHPNTPPPRAMPSPPPPSSDYTIAHRFSLLLGYPDPDANFYGEWQTSIREMSFWGDLHWCLSLNLMPVDLEDFTCLYQRQIDAGHTERLKAISAHCIRAWAIPDFQIFSRIASASLSHLELAGEYDASRVGISFSDLPELTSIIRADLPNLEALHLAIRGPAEAVCQAILHDGVLCESGTLKVLKLYTEPSPSTLFNVIRACAPLLSFDFTSLWIQPPQNQNGEEWSSEGQMRFLRHLREQPRERRVHLATVTFLDLRIVVPSQISHLTYHADGPPRCLLEDKAAE